MSTERYKEIEIVGVNTKFIELFKQILPGDVEVSSYVSDDTDKDIAIIVYKFVSDHEIFTFRKMILMGSGIMVKVTQNNTYYYNVGTSAFVNKHINGLYTLIKGVAMPSTERNAIIETLENTNLYTYQKNTYAAFIGFPVTSVSKINEFYDGCLSNYTNSLISIRDSSYYFPFTKAELFKKSNDTLVVRVSDEKNKEVLSLISFIGKLKAPLKDVDDTIFSEIMDDIAKNGTPKNLIQITDTNTTHSSTVTSLVPMVTPSFYKKVEPIPFVLPKYNDYRDDILATFVDLTEFVVPNPNEKYVVEKMFKIIPDIQKDGFGNLFISVGESETLFSSHLDTVGHEMTKVVHTYKDGHIGTNGKTILGGDNKAGVTIMIHMIKNNIPGLYYFFLNEEKGRHGSIWVNDNRKDLLRNYKRAIAFDRREKGSIITVQRGDRTASDGFAYSLAAQFRKYGLEYRPDPTGSYTDTASFVDIIPECTNLSAGVYGEHGHNERLNVEYFLSVCEAAINIDWEILSTERKPGVKPSRDTGITVFRGGNASRINGYEPNDDDEDDDDDEYQYSLMRSAGNIGGRNNDIPSDVELLEVWNSTKTTIEKVHKLNSTQREEAIDTWKENLDVYNRMNKFLISRGFSSKDKYGLSKPILYKYRDNQPQIILMIIPDDATYFNQRVIYSQADMIAEVEQVLHKNKGKKKEIGIHFPVEYNESETMDGGYILDTKDGELETKEFLSNYGGSHETLMFFTTLNQVNKNNVYYWPAWYKILLSSIDPAEIRNYKSENLSKLLDDKWNMLIKDTGLDKTTLAYAMRDKRINAEFSQKWVKILKTIGKEPDVINTVANYIITNKKNEASAYKMFITISEEKVRIPYNIYLSVKEIFDRLYGGDNSDKEVFTWVQETLLKYHAFKQSKFPSAEDIENTFTIMSENKSNIDFTKKQHTIIISIVDNIKVELLKKKKNIQYAV